MTEVTAASRLPSLAAGLSAVLSAAAVTGLASSLTDLRVDPKWISLVLGLALLAWAGSLLVGRGSCRLPEVVAGLYGGLVALGYWSFAMLVDYKADGYPIAIFQPLPSSSDIAWTLLRDLAGGGALLYGVFLARRRRPAQQRVPAAPVGSGHELLRMARIMLVLGTACAVVLVAATGRIAFLSRDVDQVRYSQGAGLGLVTLLGYVLIPCIVLAVAAALQERKIRAQAALIAGSAAIVLLLTRAERTPLLLAMLGSLIFAASTGRKVSRRTGAVLLVSAVGFVFILGLFRFESQSLEVSAEERQVRTVFDVSPELRERAYAYKYYGEEVQFQGGAGLLPLALSVVPGRILGLAGIDKQDVYTDSSREYSAAMRSVGLYTQEKPLRVGVQGEFWMYGGWPAMLIGMGFYGFVVGRLSAVRTRDPMGAATAAVAVAYAIVALILPLAALAPIALASMMPLALRRILT